jgi:L-threonylcarbamoyladenylate synthase
MNQEIKKCLDILRTGGIILYPTDTVWGIGCDASNPIAVKKVYKIKERDESKSLIVLAANEVMLERTVVEIPEVAWQLIEVSNRPLSIIYENVKGIANNAIAENGSCAIRIVQDEFCQKLITQFRKPIISTSANISGEPTPKSYKDISPSILKKVDYVVDFNREKTTNPLPSNIIELKNNGSIKIIR